MMTMTMVVDTVVIMTVVEMVMAMVTVMVSTLGSGLPSVAVQDMSISSPSSTLILGITFDQPATCVCFA